MPDVVIRIEGAVVEQKGEAATVRSKPPQPYGPYGPAPYVAGFSPVKEDGYPRNQQISLKGWIRVASGATALTEVHARLWRPDNSNVDLGSFPVTGTGTSGRFTIVIPQNETGTPGDYYVVVHVDVAHEVPIDGCAYTVRP